MGLEIKHTSPRAKALAPNKSKKQSTVPSGNAIISVDRARKERQAVSILGD
jgi:hypothetical protein